jgi:hypothetical protein
MMKRTLLNTLLGLGLTTLAATAVADEWKFLPVMGAGYKANVTASLVGGVLNGMPARSGNYTGAEVAFNCLALQPPKGIIRSKISYGQFDHNGLKLSSFEVNPRWTTSLVQDLTIGAGPGIGLVQTTVAGVTTSMMAMQIGADLDYRIGQLNLGLGARWQNTVNKTIAAGVQGANNTLVQAKIGFNF